MLLIIRDRAAEVVKGLGNNEAEQDAYERTVRVASKIRRGNNNELFATMGMNEYRVCALSYSNFFRNMPCIERTDVEYNAIRKEDKKRYIVVEE